MSRVVYEDDLFLVEHCGTCPLPGYLILHVKGGHRSVADLGGEPASRLGLLIGMTTRAIKVAVHPERIYCLSFGELNVGLHFHLFPRTRWLLEQYWTATGTRTESIDGPRLFQWARASLGHGLVPPPGCPDVAAVCRQIHMELNPS